MPFYTRPNFEDRQVVQYSGTSISLSGDTNVDLSGNLRIKKGAFPGLIATSLDSDGTVVWGPISGISWSVSACTSPLYVNNLVSCPSSGGTIQVDAGNLALNSELNFLISLSAGTNTDEVLVIDNNGYVKTIPNLMGIGNMWHIPVGYTLTVPDNYQSFIYGDILIEGTIDLQTNAQLVILNGNIILSGGSIVGSGTTYLVTLGGGSGCCFTGGTGSCITDFYVTNIHGCSPIHIQPTSPDDVYLVEGGGNVGIGLTSASTKLHVSGTTIINSNYVMLSDTLTSIPSIPNFRGFINAQDNVNSTGYFSLNQNVSGDSGTYLFNDSLANCQLFVGGSQNFRSGSPVVGSSFYQNKVILKGNDLSNGMVFNPSASNSSSTFWWEFNGSIGMTLKGDGTNTGAYLGLALNPDGTEMPTSNLQIGGTGTTGTFKYRDGNQQSGYVLTSDSDGNATWQVSTGGGSGTTIIVQFTGNTSGSCITDLYVTNIHGCSPINVLDPTYFTYGSFGAYINSGSTVLKTDGGNVIFYEDDGTFERTFNFHDQPGVRDQIIFEINEPASPETTQLVISPGSISNRFVNNSTNNSFQFSTNGFIFGSRDTTQTSGITFTGIYNPFYFPGNGIQIQYTDDVYNPFQIGNRGNLLGGIMEHYDLSISGKSIVFGSIDGMPTAKFDIAYSGGSNNLRIREGAQNGYVLTSDSDGYATWQVSSGGGSFTGGTGSCITNLYVSNIHSCSPLHINPLDEGNIYFGSNSGVTVDLEKSGNLYVKGKNVVQTDLADPNLIVNGLESISFNGYYMAYDTTGRTTIVVSNISSSGGSSAFFGSSFDPNPEKFISINHFGDDYIRDAIAPTNGFDFYKNKGIISLGLDTDGLVLALDNNSGLGSNQSRLWFEENAESGMMIAGTGVGNGLSLGIRLNPDGTEMPTANLQIGGTGTTGTFKYKDGNQQNGYVLTSDSDGNATWQPSIGGGTGINPYYDLGSQSLSITWDVSGNSINYEVTLTGNTDLDLINVRNGDYGTLIVSQDSVGGRTIMFNTVNGSSTSHRVINGGGGSPTLTATANAIDILSFTYNGSIMFWTVGNDYT
jgi:hypothetical protein